MSCDSYPQDGASFQYGDITTQHISRFLVGKMSMSWEKPSRISIYVRKCHSFPTEGYEDTKMT